MGWTPGNGGGGGGGGAVSSVFARAGAVVAVAEDYAGVVPAKLTGATAATRYVGATASGAPGSGTFAKGDFVIAQDGRIWVCTVAGTPGTWANAAGSSAPIQTGAGAPNGVVTPTGIGYLYIDTTNGGLWIAGGTTNNDWLGVGGDTGDNAIGVRALIGSPASLQKGTETSVTVYDGDITAETDGTFNVVGSAGTVFSAGDSSSVPAISFFGGSVAPQPVLTPLSTAADIVAALQSLGLVG